MSIRALHTGYTGLMAAQVGIDTASNNVANANTDGYTRQRVVIESNLPTSYFFGQVGNGVHVEDITRTRDALLDDRVRNATSSFEALSTRAELLGRVEATFGEPEYGISAELDALWSSFEELSLDPTSRGSQGEVLHRLDALTARIRQITTELDAMADSARDAIGNNVDEINLLIGQIATLNDAIGQASIDATPNQLMDQRDLAIDQLAALTGARSRIDDDGAAHVTLSGLSLVNGKTANLLAFDPATDEITHVKSGIAISPSGQLGGQHQFLTEDVPVVRASLSALAVELHDVLNAQHAAGFSDSGVAGGPLLSYVVSDPALSISVTITDPSALASSSTDGVPFPVHNGENAMALADLRTSLAAAGGTQTLGGLARELVADVGSRVATSSDSASAQSDLATAARLSRETTQGVSLDEEMIDLMRFQRSYAAAARVITTADSALDVLINRTGIVGR